jgi:hypothetical protein
MLAGRLCQFAFSDERSYTIMESSGKLEFRERSRRAEETNITL